MPTHRIGHRILEMVYDSMVRSDVRVWSPRELLYGAMMKICHAKERKPPEMQLFPFHSLFDIDNALHKRKINKALVQLASSGVFDGLFELARLEGNTNLIKGTNLAPILVMKHLLVLFPGYDSGYLSEIIQLICSHDNFEDVFTVLGGLEIVQNFPVSKSFWDSDYLRAILGELHNIIIERPRICKISIELRSLAQYTFHACIAELMLRVIESLVNQVDPVWRRQYSAPFMNSNLPKGHVLNRKATNSTVSKPAFKSELESLQVNRYVHESWHSMSSSRSLQVSKNPCTCLTPHSYSTFRPRFAHFFKEDSGSSNAYPAA